MDTLFMLGQESRLRILEQAAARVPGCAYLCVWAPVSGLLPPPHSAEHRHLLCLDAWLCGGDDDHRVRALFDAYRGSLCAAVRGCVPGWAYADGRPYMELQEHDLPSSASLPAQQLFYQEAGIKMAAFMGCESGEIEVGVSAAAAAQMMNLQACVEQVFSEDFFQQSLLEELLQLPPTRPSSSSSSLPSVSVGSPADGSTSLLRTTMPVMSSSATPSPRDLTVSPALLHPRPPHPAPFGRHGHGHVHFPSAEADDAAMTEAMLAVISSSSPLPIPCTPPAGNHRAQRSPRRGSSSKTAFRAYNAALAPRAPRRPPGAPGQRMIKMGISILRRTHMLRCNHQERTTGAAARRGHEEEEEAAPPAPTSSQLHHMISERRRRERLNESFEELRGLLPPGSKKDKATVLAKTLEYMNFLIAQISNLEANNRSLEAAQIHQRVHGGAMENRSRSDQALRQEGPSRSSERVQVEVTSAAAASTSSSSSPHETREVTVRVVAARARGDALSELVLRVLALLRDTGRFTVVAVDATISDDGVAQASLTLRATASEFDEVSLKEAVTKVVEGLVTPPEESP